MYHLSHNAQAIAKGVLYLCIGLIFGLSAIGILTGSLKDYLLIGIAVYFIVYGFFLSGFYDAIMNLLNNKRK